MQALASTPLRLAAALMLLVATGCSNSNLGGFDDKMDNRDDMPGPGVFAQDDGKPALSWTVGEGDSDAALKQTDSTTDSAAATAGAAKTTAADRAEFEQFKAWNELRTSGRDSEEYREFQQWLEYRKFKSAE